VLSKSTSNPAKVLISRRPQHKKTITNCQEPAKSICQGGMLTVFHKYLSCYEYVLGQRSGTSQVLYPPERL